MIIEKNKDIWQYHNDPKNIIVIPTNAGWTLKQPYKGILGAGLAKQALVKFPEIAEVIGKQNRDYYIKTAKTDIPIILFNKLRLLIFNTKALNPITPYLSFKHNADLKTIVLSLIQFDELQKQYGDFYNFIFPQVGCGVGTGNLSWLEVKPVLLQYLSKYDNVIILENDIKPNYKKDWRNI